MEKDKGVYPDAFVSVQNHCVVKIQIPYNVNDNQ
jgi:hypothetical protein